MSTPRIDSMTITYQTGPTRKKPKAGDEKVVKGITMIRQQVIVYDPRCGSAYLCNNGRPTWEWVVKGGDKDRMAWRHKP